MKPDLSQLPPELLQALLQRIEQLSGIKHRGPLHSLERVLNGLSRGATLPDTAQKLLELSDEAFMQQVVHGLTIHETYFFRDAAQMDLLRRVVFPQKQAAGRELKIWSAGCSTGEEAYSIAMMLNREFPDLRYTILGTDLHPDAVSRARQGRYSNWSFRNTPDELKQACFTETPEGWLIRPEHRHQVHFGLLNLMEGVWNPRFNVPGLNLNQLDLVLCRNVTLYFGGDRANQVYKRFRQLLKPDGMLMVGVSDPQPRPSSGLVAERHPQGWLWKQADAPDTVPSQVPRSRPPAPHLILRGKPEPKKPVGPPAARPVDPAPVQPHPEPGPNTEPVSGPVPGLPREQLPLPDHLDGLRQHVFLHPEDLLAVYQLAQMWLKQHEVERARVLLLRVRRQLEGSDPSALLRPDLTRHELLAATEHLLQGLKGHP